MNRRNLVFAVQAIVTMALLVMLFRPAGLLPSAVRKRELTHDRST